MLFTSWQVSFLHMTNRNLLMGQTKFSSEHESRHIIQRHPQGGIAASRCDLVLHEYMRK